MSETYNKINTTVKAFVASYQAAFASKNATRLSATLTPDCTRTMQPKIFAETLGLQHNPISVADYEALVQSELPALEVGEIDMENLVIDTEKKTASFKINIHVQLKDDVKDILEFVFMLDLADACDQVKAVVQFADTAKINDNVAKIKEIVAAQQ